MILAPLQKLPKNVKDLVKLIVAKGFKKLPKVQKIANSGHTAGQSHKHSINDCREICKSRVIIHYDTAFAILGTLGAEPVVHSLTACNDVFYLNYTELGFELTTSQIRVSSNNH